MIDDINKNETYYQKNVFKDINKTLIVAAFMLPMAFSKPKGLQNCISLTPMSIYVNSKFNNCNESNYEALKTKSINPTFRINIFAEDVLGKMRNATEEENDFVFNIMISKSKKTGINILNL